MVERSIHGEGGHLVEALRQCRLSLTTHRWEIEVKWYGLDDLEASGEPADTIQEDVFMLFRAFIDADPTDPARRALDLALATESALPPQPRLPRYRSRRRGRTSAVTNA
ncbi:hypothetical protein PR003_g27537 [Phytophthora rubi]|uniref:Chromo domain-containing protein n=1 Tax=Phytophthora rubi TaxID=129364 RepID=A0A6A3HKF2_9STRA|nr:hypothetical protein PR001_g28853 [Phytophthora rubi]KAE8970749.1 hypothetical protein PR002_g27019 [Phytophthora rubi]KAE9281936.1 hypothetical protein PR003_g27537 [Phytophthora rubi]